MLSAKEMRYWVIVGLGLLWATIAWTLYEYLTGVPGGSPQESLSQLARATGHLDWSRLVGLGFGALLLTRIAYGTLRAPGASGQAVND
jgi:hypothetical protein